MVPVGAVRADWRVEWGRRGLPEASRRTRPLVGNQGLYRPAEPKNKFCGSFAVRSQFRRTSRVSSACGCEAGGGGRRKEKDRVHELVRGFGHPRANDRTDAANQGDAVQSELRNRTNREFTEPVHEPVRQFASELEGLMEGEPTPNVLNVESRTAGSRGRRTRGG